MNAAREMSAVLGGKAVRPRGTTRRTTQFGQAEVQRVIDYVTHDAGDRGVVKSDHPFRGILGEEQAAFAAEFAAVHSPAEKVNAVPVANGTRALTLALMAVGRRAKDLEFREPELGDNVIVSGLTWPGTATAALGRYVPRLADVTPETLCVDPRQVEALIDDRTAAIIAVHLYNRMADMVTLANIAAKHKLPIIEDCAHAHGADFHGKAAGTLGCAGTFSFQRSKLISLGEGGIVLTTSDLLADQLATVTSSGRVVGQALPLQGGNDRMVGIAAALGRGQLSTWPGNHATRQATFRALDEAAATTSGVRPLAIQPEVTNTPAYKWAARYDLAQFGGMSLEQLATALSAELNCHVTPTYEPLNHTALYDPHSDAFLRVTPQYWAEIDPARYDLPVAAEAHRSVLCLEHAVGLDPAFPGQYTTAMEKIARDGRRIARDLPVWR